MDLEAIMSRLPVCTFSTKRRLLSTLQSCHGGSELWFAVSATTGVQALLRFLRIRKAFQNTTVILLDIYLENRYPSIILRRQRRRRSNTSNIMNGKRVSTQRQELCALPVIILIQKKL